MATEQTEHESSGYIFDCESIPIPPGTKTRARLPRNGEPDPLPARAWWIVGGMSIVSLVVGILVERFLF
jgi:hypothetical protein